MDFYGSSPISWTYHQPSFGIAPWLLWPLLSKLPCIFWPHLWRWRERSAQEGGYWTVFLTYTYQLVVPFWRSVLEVWSWAEDDHAKLILSIHCKCWIHRKRCTGSGLQLFHIHLCSWSILHHDIWAHSRSCTFFKQVVSTQIFWVLF